MQPKRKTVLYIDSERSFLEQQIQDLKIYLPWNRMFEIKLDFRMKEDR